MDISIRELDLEIIKFQKYGKGFVKQQKLSPDSFVQVREVDDKKQGRTRDAVAPRLKVG